MRALLAIALSLALVSCKPKQPDVLHIDPALESLVPADTVFVVGANLEAIRDTPVYQKLLSRMPLPQLDQFTRQTGLDPRKDLSQILSCSDGKHGLLLARGKFNRSDLEARLQKQGAAPMSYKNYQLFGTEQAAVFFLNDSTGIAGPAAQLRAIIDQPASGGMPASAARSAAHSPARRSDLCRTERRPRRLEHRDAARTATWPTCSRLCDRFRPRPWAWI